LSPKPVRCGDCIACGSYRTAATSTSPTGAIARGPFPLDPPPISGSLWSGATE
jgi:hypothetical protein